MKSNAKIVIERLKARLEKKMNELPPVLMNEGQRVFTDNFRNESWEGKRWRARIHRGKKENTKPILIGRTRKLINSVRTSGRSASMQKIVWGTYVPYAKIHNEGFRGVVYVKPHKRHGKTITTKVKGSAGFVNGKFTKGKSSTLKLLGAKHQVKAYSYRLNMPKRQFMGVGNTLRMKLIKKCEQILKA